MSAGILIGFRESGSAQFFLSLEDDLLVRHAPHIAAKLARSPATGASPEHFATGRRSHLGELARSQRAAKEELDRARGDAKIRDAEIRKIQAGIETRTMRSPVNGVVTEIKRDLSEAVSMTNPHVLTVVQIDRLIVNLFLPPQRSAKLTVGASAILLGENAGRVPAVVKFISPVTDAASGTVRVKFVVANTAGKLRSGVTAFLAE